jgi:hypothetical protein
MHGAGRPRRIENNPQTRRPRGIVAALKPDYAPHLRVKGTKSWAADEPQKPGG